MRLLGPQSSGSARSARRSYQGSGQNAKSYTLLHRVLGISIWLPIKIMAGVRMLRFYTCDAIPGRTTKWH